jgi:hypothetical protein
MTLTAVTFAVTNPNAETIGLAVLCVEARYASMRWRGVDRVDRRFASPAEWKDMEHQLKMGLSTKPLPPAGVFARVLTGGGPDRIVRWLNVTTITVDDPAMAVQAFDAHLKRQPVELRQTLKQIEE